MLQRNTFNNLIAFKNEINLTNRRNQYYRFVLLVFFLFCSFLLKAQFDDEKYDKESFLIGTLVEYMNYQRTFTDNGMGSYYQIVDRFLGQDELRNALFIDSLFNSDYSDITIRLTNEIFFTMFSPALSLKIDDYYDYVRTNRETARPGVDTFESDVIYEGHLKKERFETEIQKLSFLLGAFLRYGRDRDKTNSMILFLKRWNFLEEYEDYEKVSYGVLMQYAPTKAKTIAEFLKELGCDAEYVMPRTTIPVGHFVIFRPSDKVQEIIDEAERLKKHIEAIDTAQAEFTPDGTKYFLVEPVRPFFFNKILK